MDDMTLRVGLEVETVLVSRYHWKLSLDKFAKRLTNEYNASVKGQGYSFMHTDIDGDYDGPAEYKEWSVTDDSTIATKSDSEYPIEIVAPIMFFNGQSGWRREVNHMFHVVNTLCKIGSNTSCGTHIHISPGLGDWSTGQLKSVCKAILYFESAFEVLVPESRRGNQWAKSNRFDNNSFFGRNSQQCFALIEACENPVQIADLMSPDRYYAWNFDNLYYGRKATIEFRRPPGVVNPDVCLSWMELTISFVQSARRGNLTTRLARYEPDVDGLKAFVSEGLVQGMSDPRYLASIFHGKSGALQPRPVQRIDGNLLKKKMKQDKKKNVMMKKFKKLAVTP